MSTFLYSLYNFNLYSSKASKVCILIKKLFNNAGCVARRKAFLKISVHHHCTFRNDLFFFFLRSGKKITIRVPLGSAEVLNQCVVFFLTWIRFISLIKILRVCKILLNDLWQAITNLSFLGYHQHTLYH